MPASGRLGRARAYRESPVGTPGVTPTDAATAARLPRQCSTPAADRPQSAPLLARFPAGCKQKSSSLGAVIQTAGSGAEQPRSRRGSWRRVLPPTGQRQPRERQRPSGTARAIPIVRPDRRDRRVAQAKARLDHRRPTKGVARCRQGAQLDHASSSHEAVAAPADQAGTLRRDRRGLVLFLRTLVACGSVGCTRTRWERHDSVPGWYR